jgi:hypothetical protein
LRKFKRNIENNAEFFDEKWQVINEKDIMISENGESSVYRPDRILKSPEGYVIVDFKTGEESEKMTDKLPIIKIFWKSWEERF